MGAVDDELDGGAADGVRALGRAGVADREPILRVVVELVGIHGSTSSVRLNVPGTRGRRRLKKRMSSTSSSTSPSAVSGAAPAPSR